MDTKHADKDDNDDEVKFSFTACFSTNNLP